MSNFKVDGPGIGIIETGDGVDGENVFATFPQAKTSLVNRYEQQVTYARAQAAKAKALRAKDSKSKADQTSSV